MKYFTYLIIFFSINVFSQTQIGNSDFELWDNLGQTNEEPTNWNSFKTASGTWNSFGSQQVKRSTDIRPGSNGTYSMQIWTKNVTLAIANGNVTLGRINMGSTTPNSPDNYNYSQTDDTQFSEALNEIPDSIVFWTKFTPINSSHEARLSCAIHDNTNFKDPNDINASSKVAEAIYNFPSTNGDWVRKSFPFTKTTNNNPQFIIVTFTSNKTPGVGTDNGSESTRDNLWIDDLELIYSSTSKINEIEKKPYIINVQNNDLQIISNGNKKNNIKIFNQTGLLCYDTISDENVVDIRLKPGYYFIKIESDNKCFNSKAIIY